jgi:hypothetical protein
VFNNRVFENTCPKQMFGSVFLPQPPGCEATGVPESHQNHLPITNWNIDGPDIANILRANHFDPRNVDPSISNGGVNVTITTVGRAKATIFGPSTSPSYPDDKSIIIAIFQTGDFNYYIVLSANDGTVLNRGGFPVLYPP